MMKNIYEKMRIRNTVDDSFKIKNNKKKQRIKIFEREIFFLSEIKFHINDEKKLVSLKADEETLINSRLISETLRLYE